MKINKKLIAEHYDRYGEGFERHCLDVGGDFHKRVKEYLGRYVRRDTLLLNVAGGDGWATSLLDSSKVRIVNTDISKELLDVSRKRRSNTVFCIIHDFDEPNPFLDETFDYVVCTGALEFCADIFFTLSEMYRVLKRDGLMLFTTDRLDPKSEFQKDATFVFKPGFFSRRYRTSEVEKMLGRIGGKIEAQGMHNAYRVNDEWVKYDYFLVRKPK